MKKIYYYVIAVLVVLILGFSLKGKISGTKFNIQTWKYSNLNLESNWGLRWNMMNDLRNNNQLIGMNKSQIVILLGQPEGKFKNIYNYNLGYTGTGINTGTLVLSFNQNNIVEKIKVFQG